MDNLPTVDKVCGTDWNHNRFNTKPTSKKQTLLDSGQQYLIGDLARRAKVGKEGRKANSNSRLPSLCLHQVKRKILLSSGSLITPVACDNLTNLFCSYWFQPQKGMDDWGYNEIYSSHNESPHAQCKLQHFAFHWKCGLSPRRSMWEVFQYQNLLLSS